MTLQPLPAPAPVLTQVTGILGRVGWSSGLALMGSRLLTSAVIERRRRNNPQTWHLLPQKRYSPHLQGEEWNKEQALQGLMARYRLDWAVSVPRSKNIQVLDI